jgi:hypothetical protein
MAIPETKSISSPSITCRVERRAIIVLGQDTFQAGSRHLDRGHRLVDQLADARLLGVGLKVRFARLLRHPEPVLGQILLVEVLAGCGILGGPLNVHHSNYVPHVGLVLAVTKATK